MQRFFADFIIVLPIPPDVSDIFPAGGITFTPGGIEISDGSTSFPESLHHQFIPLKSNLHSPAGNRTLGLLVVELPDISEHFAAIIVLPLLDLCLHHFFGGTGLLDLAATESPVKNRDGET